MMVWLQQRGTNKKAAPPSWKANLKIQKPSVPSRFQFPVPFRTKLQSPSPVFGAVFFVDFKEPLKYARGRLDIIHLCRVGFVGIESNAYPFLSFKSIDLNPVLTLPVSTFESDDVVALSFAWFSTKHQQLWMTNFDRLPCQLNLCPLCTVALLEGTVKLLSNVILQPEGAAPNPEVVRCLHVQRLDL